MFAPKPALVVVSTMRESSGRRGWILISAAVATGYLFRSFATHSVSDRANVGHLIQHSRANLRLARPSGGCTAEQQKQQAQAFSEKIKANHKRWSSCPSETIMKAIHAADPAPSDMVMVNIGANKGYAIVDALALWRPDLGITPTSWHAALVEQNPKAKGLCGVCNDCREKGGEDMDAGNMAVGTSSKPAFTVHAVEPLPTNLPLLRGLQARANVAEGVTMFVHPGAVGPLADTPLYFNASSCTQVGRESCILATAGGPGMHEVTAWSLPSFVAEHRLDRIDFLMIDSEGYDGAILLNSVDFLNTRTARMIEFEYHAIGMWGSGPDQVQLKQVVDVLDAAGYACYLQGRDGTLVDLGCTCWDPAFEFFYWSNVLCPLRGDVWHAAADRMCAWKTV